MNQIAIYYWQSPVGELILGSYDEKLCLADWRYRKQRERIDRRLQKALKAEYVESTSGVIEETVVQLEEYFAKKRKDFDIPLLLAGTDFQKSVWEGLMQIPYGTVTSYLDLAKSIGNAKAVRAVASANGANAISILVPCHRVVGSDGMLRGYAGGLDVKKKLLSLENSNT
jgi:methylated-DNA-[protein]-cysteine S-methyltransferase